VQNDGGFFVSTSIRESFLAEQTEHALGPDPFSPKQLRLLRALTDAIFSEVPADPASRQENDELVASFAELFCPALPEEQARSQLALLVTTLLEEAAEAGFRPKDQALLDLLSESTSMQQAVTSTSDASANGEPRSFSSNEEAMISSLMQHFGRSRADAIDELMEFGFL
jgi:hypothetical protein